MTPEGGTGRRRGPRPVNERLSRLLVMLPWLADQGEVTIDEVAERFGLRPADALEDLTIASMCGSPPYGGGDLLDLFVDVDEGTVVVGPGLRRDARPLRLSPSEAVSVLAAVRAALDLPGAEPDGPLARAATKLDAVLGGGVEVGLAEPPFLALVREAAQRNEQVRLEYFSASRGETSERTVAPRRVFSSGGEWYVLADDDRSGEERVFRVDRIEAAEPTGTFVAPRDAALPEGWFEGADLPMVEVVLPPSAAWLAEQYPVHSAVRRDDGWVEVVLPVSSDRWFERFALRAGPEAVVRSPERYREVARAAAARLLARYRA